MGAWSRGRKEWREEESRNQGSQTQRTGMKRQRGEGITEVRSQMEILGIREDPTRLRRPGASGAKRLIPSL